MRILGAVAKWLFILCLPVLFLSASISLAFNSPRLYEYGFDKYHVSLTTGLADAELDKAAAGLIRYFNSGEDYISLKVVKNGQPLVLFNQREVAHLKDVKALVWLNYRLLLGSLTFALIYSGISLFWHRRACRRRLAQGMVTGSLITLAMMLALGLGVWLNFDQLFLQFHLLSFANDFWQLDPSTDYLIMLFPAGFWFDVTIFATLTTVIMAAITAGAGWGYLRYTGGQTTAGTPASTP